MGNFFKYKIIDWILINSINNCLQGPSHIKRATTEKLREIFQKYSSYQKNGEYFMTSEDFIRGYLGLFPESNYNKVSWSIILVLICKIIIQKKMFIDFG